MWLGPGLHTHTSSGVIRSRGGATGIVILGRVPGASVCQTVGLGAGVRGVRVRNSA